MNNKLRNSVVFSALCLIVLIGCGSDNERSDTTQVIAKVDGREITIHQLNFELSDKRFANQTNREQVQRVLLERLIDQALLVDKAMEKELHRNPITSQAIERSKQKILAQAYLQTLFGVSSPPTNAKIQQFYEERPELFSKRRVYQLQQLSFDGSSDHKLLKAEFERMNDFEEFAGWVKSQEIRSKQEKVARGAERILTPVLARIKDLEPGTGVFIEGGNSAIAVWVVAAKEAPLTLAQATPFIQKHLESTENKAAIEKEIKRLRANSQVEYVGVFSEDNTAKDTVVTTEESDIETDAASSDFVDKGISGLK